MSRSTPNRPIDVSFTCNFRACLLLSASYLLPLHRFSYVVTSIPSAAHAVSPSPCLVAASTGTYERALTFSRSQRPAFLDPRWSCDVCDNFHIVPQEVSLQLFQRAFLGPIPTHSESNLRTSWSCKDVFRSFNASRSPSPGRCRAIIRLFSTYILFCPLSESKTHRASRARVVHLDMHVCISIHVGRTLVSIYALRIGNLWAIFLVLHCEGQKRATYASLLP